MKVSILIPCYNSEAWISETLESALGQTWHDKEIIVVDDGSIDGSLSVAKSFETHNLKVISQENRGGSAARNRALQEAQGEFIQFLDADDILALDKIEQQVHLLRRNQDCVATCRWAKFTVSPNSSDVCFLPQPIWRDLSPVEWLVNVWEGKGTMYPAAWLVPRSIIERAGPWNEDLSLDDDGEYFSRIVLASTEVKFCMEARSYYRSNVPNSVSGRKSQVAWQSAFRSLELGTKYLIDQEDSQRTRHACATAFQNFIYNVYPDVPELAQRAEEKVRILGGTDLEPRGTPLFKMLSKVLGWKLARRIHKKLRPRCY